MRNFFIFSLVNAFFISYSQDFISCLINSLLPTCNTTFACREPIFHFSTAISAHTFSRNIFLALIFYQDQQLSLLGPEKLFLPMRKDFFLWFTASRYSTSYFCRLEIAKKYSKVVFNPSLKVHNFSFFCYQQNPIII